MVDVAITETAQAVNTRSGDLVGSGTAITTGQTFSLAVKNKTDDIVLILEETGSSTATFTFDAGDDPPSKREGLGALAIAMAANDLRLLTLEGGRFIQSDGLITGSLVGTGKLTILKLDRKW